MSSKRLVFVTGKGGVGKSVCAAALALGAAKKGRKVCLVELGSQSFYEAFFETRGISYEPTEVMHDVHISLLTPAESIREYVLNYLKIPKLYELFFQNRVMKAFLNAAPALAEIAILGKLTSEIRGITKSEYDLFVVDCYSTGHAMALLRAPRGLSETFKGGPLHEQAKQIDLILRDPKETGYVVVSLAEEMPVTETAELVQKIKSEFHGDIKIICNRLLRPPVNLVARKQIRDAIEDRGLSDFIEFLDFREEHQNLQLARLKELGLPISEVGQILKYSSSEDFLTRISNELGDLT